MQISITGQNIEVTPSLKDYTEEKVKKVRKFLNSTINAHVVLKMEKHEHVAEVTIHANGVDLHGIEKTENMYAAIDSVMDKIDRQAKKYKGKILAKKKGGPAAHDLIDHIDKVE
ncbi:Ribosome hibernation protein YhbH [hydrothermal vent metagenome]|uniref:Ribosome hibernation protein YhbH n=1 Tax=hydrothermal vent metagenome TaxID=652676 RepID=A0A3B1C0B9_9ZZZZ